MEIVETVDAKKQRFEGAAALKLIRQAEVIVVAKGKNVRRIDLKSEDIPDEELLQLILGPSGNLRAPTIRRGNTWFIGFHPDEYTNFLDCSSRDQDGVV